MEDLLSANILILIEIMEIIHDHNIHILFAALVRLLVEADILFAAVRKELILLGERDAAYTLEGLRFTLIII